MPERPLPYRATATVASAPAMDVRYFAKHLVHDAGFFIGELTAGPTFHGSVGSPDRTLRGFVGGERNLVRSAKGESESRRTAVGVLVGGLATLLGVSAALGLYMGIRGVTVGVVLAAPVLGYALIRLQSIPTFDSEVVCIAYSGKIAPGGRLAPENQPVSLAITITAGTIRSHNAGGGSKGRGFSARLFGSVLTDSGGPSKVPSEIAARLGPGASIPSEPADREEPDLV
ncbi:MAG: hypothetical protein L3K18_09020 [Thermoplasmata archaeon]|nr:hypothetical protein [Thermoplasmata archaeon]MCI4357259.1 hypothetical protein [Thermoplasmata archaeon]